MTKTASIHFDRETFTDEAQTWYQLITSRVRAVERVNARLANNFGRSSRLSVGAGIPLEESDLDIIYDMVDGKTILYQYGGRNETREVRVGEAHPGAELTLEPVKRGNRLTGVAISGTLPRLLRGNLHRYILDQSAFGRVSDDELRVLAELQLFGQVVGHGDLLTPGSRWACRWTGPRTPGAPRWCCRRCPRS